MNILLILTIGFTFLACITFAFGVAGAGTAKKTIQRWILPLFIANLVSAYFYGGLGAVAISLFVTLLVAAILAAAVNKRHGGMSHDEQLSRVAHADVDKIIEGMVKKQK